MRLIDADNINFHCNYDGDCTGDIDDCKKCGNYVCDFRNIQEQPTAYDINKVVEELEGINGLIRGRKTCSECEHITYCFYGEQLQKVAIDKAIEIVKQGGVSDDVCEWKIKDACYTSSIKHYDALPTSIVKTFTNCPYCGKKIKVV